MIALAALLATVLGVAWLTGAAASMHSARRIWLRHWAERGGRGSGAAFLYLHRPEQLVQSASTAAAALILLYGLSIGAMADGTVALALHIGTGALVVLLFGQVLPRALARRWATKLVPLLVPVLRPVNLVIAPFFAFNSSSGQAAPVQAEPAMRAERDSLEDLLREGESEGVGEREAMAMISGVVQFGDKTAGDVMTPRDSVFALDHSLSAHELSHRVAEAGYSRVPVFRHSLDDIVGIVHVFDIIKATPSRPLQPRRITTVGSTVHCNELLSTMLRDRVHLAIVRDEDGRTAGLVTLDDLLEELVGDIRDERDDPAPGRERLDG